MPLSNGQLTIGSTAMSLTITGGTACTLTAISADAGSRELVFASDTVPATRRRLKVRTQEPRVNASMPSGFTMRKKNWALIVPVPLANGKIEYNKYSLSVDESVETTTTQMTDNRRLIAQLTLDADTDDFYLLNSTL